MLEQTLVEFRAGEASGKHNWRQRSVTYKHWNNYQVSHLIQCISIVTHLMSLDGDWCSQQDLLHVVCEADMFTWAVRLKEDAF